MSLRIVPLDTSSIFEVMIANGSKIKSKGCCSKVQNRLLIYSSNTNVTFLTVTMMASQTNHTLLYDKIKVHDITCLTWNTTTVTSSV